MAEKVILITGASKGIGFAIGRLLAERGYTVFGTSRQPEQHPVTAFPLLPLDVCDDGSAKACVDAVIERAGRIDVLINNAGVSLSGALEEASVVEVKRVFETNFFGVLRMVNAALPVMRRQRSGQIINMSSLAGLAGVPYLGAYVASKFALEGYTESLRQEVKGFGIQVSLAEPGDIHTTIAVETPAPAQSLAAYDGTRERINAMHEANVEKAPPPEVVARRVLHLVENARPGLRYPITSGIEWLVPLGRRIFPYSLAERMLRGYYKLGK